MPRGKVNINHHIASDTIENDACIEAGAVAQDGFQFVIAEYLTTTDRQRATINALIGNINNECVDNLGRSNPAAIVKINGSLFVNAFDGNRPQIVCNNPDGEGDWSGICDGEPPTGNISGDFHTIIGRNRRHHIICQTVPDDQLACGAQGLEINIEANSQPAASRLFSITIDATSSVTSTTLHPSRLSTPQQSSASFIQATSTQQTTSPASLTALAPSTTLPNTAAQATSTSILTQAAVLPASLHTQATQAASQQGSASFIQTTSTQQTTSLDPLTTSLNPIAPLTPSTTQPNTATQATSTSILTQTAVLPTLLHTQATQAASQQSCSHPLSRQPQRNMNSSSPHTPYGYTP